MAKTKRSKAKREELAGQADPRAPLDSAAFLAASQPVLARLEEDLLARAKASPAVTRALEARYEAEKQANRTAESFAGWTAALATQVAAAWLLSCVFVRTLEDRGLLKQGRIAGAGAEDSQRQFFQLAPSLTERDYLLTVFRELAHHPAARDLFDAEHSLVWKLSPSAEAAKELLALFRTPNAGEPAFRFGQASTRFLGDLYQDLSEEVRKRYALLQTPDFVEEFILDRTLEPAIQRFGLDDTTLIDPTCGSGHFLLGAFDRLFEHRLRAEPGVDPRVAAVRALDCVYGADINPYAVAIARFRLTLSFLDKAGYKKLADAPALPLHLVVADSLRINPQHPQQELWQQEGVSAQRWLGDVFMLEDDRAARDVLFRQYAVVVGNPPYITVKDAAMREVYRRMYETCHRTYSLSVPFCERFFQLSRPRGYTGQITANSFMKREFGKVLVETFLPKINLDHIINTSGAYIPGHGTPTVLLFGTVEAPQGKGVLAVLAKRGEPSPPSDPSRGLVWRSIVEHGAEVGFENDYLSVAMVDRAVLAKHPWSLGGGGAAELKELLEERAPKRLGEIVSLPIGRAARTGADDVYTLPPHLARAICGGDDTFLRDLLIGEAVRDWSIGLLDRVIFPYDTRTDLSAADPNDPRLQPVLRFLWPWRVMLADRATFQGNMESAGLRWFEYMQFTRSANATPLSIVFAFVATHNHFSLARGGKVFNRTAPVIKLPMDATEDDHLALLAYLNSSTACFWMKQVLFDKGNQGGERGRPTESFEAYFEFDGTKLAGLPLPAGFEAAKEELAAFGRALCAVAEERARCLDFSTAFAGAVSSSMIREQIDERLALVRSAQARQRELQEQLDWYIYRLFDLTNHRPHVFEKREGGARLCDFLWARDALSISRSVRYFDLCHVGDPAEIVSPQWVAKWELLADEEALNESEAIRIIETPAYKRTYKDSFGPVDLRYLGRTYLVHVLEDIVSARTELIALRVLFDELRVRIRATVEWCEESDSQVVRKLADEFSVPFVAACRYSETGMAKNALWEAMWSQQRVQDAGGPVVPTPAAKYTAGDFSDHSTYRLRGPLDVPKEHFIAYPFCESDNDGEPVYGWAGWDHLQRAQALATLYLKRKSNEGWTRERLIPMLAGLLELIPWVKQWHNEPSAEFNGLRMGDYYEQFLDGECRLHGLTHDDLRAWRPPKRTRGKAKAASQRRELDDKAKAADEPQDISASAPASIKPATAKPAKKPRTRKKPSAAPAETPAADEGD